MTGSCALQPKPTIAYIDGLNLCAEVEGRPEAKWIDLHTLATRLVQRDQQLISTKYFTSQISGKAAEDPASPKRQRNLIRAARATPGVEVFEGKFTVPEEWRTVSSKGSWPRRFRPHLPDELVEAYPDHLETHEVRPWKVKVQLPQEEFTDVAIASHLRHDFYIGRYSHAILVSNDSDLAPAVRLAVADGHTVGVFSPVQTVSRDLGSAASWSRSIRRDLPDHRQMPDEEAVPGSSRTISRPRAWKSTETPPRRGFGS